MNADLERINKLCIAARARTRVTPERQEELLREKERLLKRGLIVLMRADDYEARERFLAEYQALSRIINENEQILGAAA